jgi:ribosomal protein L29
MSAKKTADLVKELRALDAVALDVKLNAAKEEIYNIRRSRLSQPEVNVKNTKANRKNIARILTIKRQREIAAAQGAK